MHGYLSVVVLKPAGYLSEATEAHLEEFNYGQNLYTGRVSFALALHPDDPRGAAL